MPDGARHEQPCVAAWARADQIDDVAGLATGWRVLQLAAHLPTQSLSYARCLAQTMAQADDTRLLYAMQDGALAAVLPLVRGQGGRWARWRLLGAHEVYEPGDVLAQGHEAVTALAEALARQPRPVVLARVPAGSPLGPALTRAMRGRALVTIRPAKPCPTLALGVGWRDPVSQFNAGRRSDFRRAQRRAAEMGAVSYEMLCPTPAEFADVFDEAIGVEARGWKAGAGTALGSDPEKCAFFRGFFADAAAQGSLRVAFMRIDGRAVAMQLALEMQGRYWLFKIGYDEAYGRCSPGSLLMAHCIADAAGRGLAAFELLGQAEDWIARQWTGAAHECLCIRTYPFSLRGAVALGLDGWRWLRARVFGGWLALA